jgi:hypothetical protein
MAVPTITDISPTTGLARGLQLATITGTNFRLPPTPGTGPVEYVPTVSVTVNGRAAVVAVLSATEIRISTPSYMGEPEAMSTAVDVVLKNLDDNGDPISGEEVTAAAAYTYKRPDLTADHDGYWITTALVQALRRNLLANTWASNSPDYSADPATQVTFTGELPAITVDSPRIVENKLLRDNDPQVETDPSGGKTRRKGPLTEDFLYDILLIGRSPAEAHALRDEARDFFAERAYFELPASPTDSTIVEIRLIVEGEWAPVDNVTDVTFSYENTIRFEAVPSSVSSPLPTFFTDEATTEELTTEDMG